MNRILLIIFILSSINLFAQTQPRLVLPVGHTGGISDIAISDDQRLIAFASYEGSITVWDYKSQTLLSKLAPFSGVQIKTHIFFFPNSDSLYCYISEAYGTSTQPKKIIIYDLARKNEPSHIIDLDSISFFNYNNFGQIANYGMLNAEWNQLNQQFVITPMRGTVFSYSLKTKNSEPICYGRWKDKRLVISNNNIIISLLSRKTRQGDIIEDEHLGVWLYSLNGELLDKQELFEDENSTILDCEEPADYGGISQTIYNYTIPNYVRRTFESDSIVDSVFVFTSEDNKLKKKFHSHFTYPKIQGSDNFLFLNYYYMVKDTNLLVSYPNEIWDSPIKISFIDKDSTFILKESINNYYWSDHDKTIKKYSAATKIESISNYLSHIPKNHNQTTFFFDTHLNGIKKFDLESGNISHSFQKEGKQSTLLKINENLFANVLSELIEEKKEGEKETFKQSYVLSNDKFSPRSEFESYNIYTNPLICDSNLYFIDTNIIFSINKLNIHNNELISKAIDSVNNYLSYINFGSQTLTNFNLIELNNSFIALCSDSMSYIFDKKDLTLAKKLEGTVTPYSLKDSMAVFNHNNQFKLLNLYDWKSSNIMNWINSGYSYNSDYHKTCNDGKIIAPFQDKGKLKFKIIEIDRISPNNPIIEIDTQVYKNQFKILGKTKSNNWTFYSQEEQLNDTLRKVSFYAYNFKKQKTKLISTRNIGLYTNEIYLEGKDDEFIFYFSDTLHKFNKGKIQDYSPLKLTYDEEWISNEFGLFLIKVDSSSISFNRLQKNLKTEKYFKLDNHQFLGIGDNQFIYTLTPTNNSMQKITCWNITSDRVKPIKEIIIPTKKMSPEISRYSFTPFTKAIGGIIQLDDSSSFIFNDKTGKTVSNFFYLGNTPTYIILSKSNKENYQSHEVFEYHTLNSINQVQIEFGDQNNFKSINNNLFTYGSSVYTLPELKEKCPISNIPDAGITYLTCIQKNDSIIDIYKHLFSGNKMSIFYHFSKGNLLDFKRFYGNFITSYKTINSTYAILEKTNYDQNKKSSIYLVDIENLIVKGAFSSEIPDDWGEDKRISLWKVVHYDEKKEVLFVFQSNGKIIQLDPTNLSFIKSFEGHKTSINNLFFVNDSIFMTQSNDLEKKYWNLKTGKCLLNLLIIDEKNHLSYDEHYRFDGTPGAIEKLYFVCGLEVVELNQIKDSLYVPNLVQRIMNGENLDHLPKLSDLNICGVTPVVEPLENDKSGNQGYRIIPRSGGVGDVDVYINGVVRLSTNAKKLKRIDANYMLYVEKELLELYLIPGEESKVKVIAKTANNSISSRGILIDIETDEKTTFKKPALHAIMIGVDDYKGEGLDLNYAAKDANDLQTVLQKSAQKFFNIDDTSRVHFYNLTVNRSGANGNEKIKGITPDRTNIINTIAEIEKTSKPEDILVLFFAGHGEIVDKDQLLLLTSESSREDFKGLRMRELLELLNKVPAGKRVLILDACHSGAAINNLDMAQLTGKRDVKDAERQSQRLKELDKLASKSGFAIITASSSDQKALELPQYEHGLMTYALLNAMLNNKSSLDENNQLQLDKWLMATEEEVRKLYANQSAERMVPINFTLGKVDDEVRSSIVLKEIPLVYIKNVINTDLAYDNLEIETKLNEYFSNRARGGDKSLLLASVDQTNATLVNILYTKEKNIMNLKITILKNNQVHKQFTKTGTEAQLNDLIKEIAMEIEVGVK